MVNTLNGEESIELFSVVEGLTIEGGWVSTFHGGNDSIIFITTGLGLLSLGENNIKEGNVFSVVFEVTVRVELGFNELHGRLSSTIRGVGLTSTNENKGHGNSDISSETFKFLSLVVGVGSAHFLVDLNTIDDDVFASSLSQSFWVFESLVHFSKNLHLSCGYIFIASLDSLSNNRDGISDLEQGGGNTSNALILKVFDGSLKLLHHGFWVIDTGQKGIEVLVMEGSFHHP